MLKKIKLKTVSDETGNLSVLEFEDYIDWPVKRVYYLTDVKSPRGKHTVKGEKKFYICQKGKVNCRFHDGKGWQEFALQGPGDAILMEGDYFREFYDFSEDAVLLALSSLEYDPNLYIYDFDEFLEFVNS